MMTAVFLTMLSMSTRVFQCSGPTRATFNVVALHGSVDTSTDLTLAQISEMAHRANRIGKHSPLGFYMSIVAYTVSTQINARNEIDCRNPVLVTVTVMLADRHIELGKELVTKPCLFSTVRDHYRRHAVADDAVVTTFTEALGVALRQLRLPPLGQYPCYGGGGPAQN